MTPKAREELLEHRRSHGLPWHSPPHQEGHGKSAWMLSAACYEQRPYVGRNADRMLSFERSLLEVCNLASGNLITWVVLPNHYHLLFVAERVSPLIRRLGRLHGRTAYQWNGEENTRGRKVWFNVAETIMGSDAHYCASFNYIHGNPVKHGYVSDPLDWPFSSAREWSQRMGQKWIEGISASYPVSEYGEGWDD